jgi:hypothetical protein
MDVQLLRGLILYFGVSPEVKAALGMGSSMMNDRVMRFWGMEHMVAMILAVAHSDRSDIASLFLRTSLSTDSEGAFP